jgi:hypothetical protein
LEKRTSKSGSRREWRHTIFLSRNGTRCYTCKNHHGTAEPAAILAPLDQQSVALHVAGGSSVCPLSPHLFIVDYLSTWRPCTTLYLRDISNFQGSPDQRSAPGYYSPWHGNVRFPASSVHVTLHGNVSVVSVWRRSGRSPRLAVRQTVWILEVPCLQVT